MAEPVVDEGHGYFECGGARRPLPNKTERARLLDEVALEIGRLVIAWNALQQSLGHLHAYLRGEIPTPEALAPWHKETFDAPQRKALLSVVSDQAPLWPDFRELIVRDVPWLVEQARSLSERRNAAIHAPISVTTTVDGSAAATTAAFGHPQGRKLESVSLVAGFQAIAAGAGKLRLFADRIGWALHHGRAEWPARPVL